MELQTADQPTGVEASSVLNSGERRANSTLEPLGIEQASQEMETLSSISNGVKRHWEAFRLFLLLVTLFGTSIVLTPEVIARSGVRVDEAMRKSDPQMLHYAERGGTELPWEPVPVDKPFNFLSSSFANHNLADLRAYLLKNQTNLAKLYHNGERKTMYHHGDLIPMEVGKVRSARSTHQLQYSISSVFGCSFDFEQDFRFSASSITPNKPSSHHKVACNASLNDQRFNFLRRLIRQHYVSEMWVDGSLPVYSHGMNYAPVACESGGPSFQFPNGTFGVHCSNGKLPSLTGMSGGFLPGIPIGYTEFFGYTNLELPDDAGVTKYQDYLYNHFNFTIFYNTDGYIVGADVLPVSARTPQEATYLSEYPYELPNVHNDSSILDITYSYEVHWKVAPGVAWENRWDLNFEVPYPGLELYPVQCMVLVLSVIGMCLMSCRFRNHRKLFLAQARDVLPAIGTPLTGTPRLTPVWILARDKVWNSPTLSPELLCVFIGFGLHLYLTGAVYAMGFFSVTKYFGWWGLEYGFALCYLTAAFFSGRIAAQCFACMTQQQQQQQPSVFIPVPVAFAISIPVTMTLVTGVQLICQFFSGAAFVPSISVSVFKVECLSSFLKVGGAYDYAGRRPTNAYQPVETEMYESGGNGACEERRPGTCCEALMAVLAGGFLPFVVCAEYLICSDFEPNHFIADANGLLGPCGDNASMCYYFCIPLPPPIASWPNPVDVARFCECRRCRSALSCFLCFPSPVWR